MQSPNFNERRDGKKPSTIILHYTGMPSASDAMARLCDPAAEVSAHYMIEEDGTQHDLVDPDKRAWHAGVSYWQGEKDMNSVSIGIEIVNPGHEFGYRAFPKVQMEAVARLCLGLMLRYNIPAANVLGHSDIAPGRKEDPGELFDWEWLASQGVGIWPFGKADLTLEKVRKVMREEKMQREVFAALGYDPDADLSDLVLAFQRHFNPQRVLDGHGSEFDDIGAVRLLTLNNL